eukprot:g57146.t1
MRAFSESFFAHFTLNLFAQCFYFFPELFVLSRACLFSELVWQTSAEQLSSASFDRPFMLSEDYDSSESAFSDSEMEAFPDVEDASISDSSTFSEKSRVPGSWLGPNVPDLNPTIQNRQDTARKRMSQSICQQETTSGEVLHISMGALFELFMRWKEKNMARAQDDD